MDAAIELYSGTLGFPEAFRSVDDAGETRLVYGAILANVMDLHGVRIELAQLPPESEHRRSMDRWR